MNEPGGWGGLVRLGREWDTLADLDPLWAILSHPDKKYGGWRLEEFFDAGTRQVDRLLTEARRLGHPRRWNRVLDVGCGVGRLAPGLLRHFDSYWGLDISPAMVAKARSLHDSRDGCRFVASSDPSLGPVADASVDLLVSVCVLQHLPHRPTICAYLASFCRVLRPGGLVVVQLPAHIPRPEKLIHDTRRTLYARLGRLGVPARVRYRHLRLIPTTMNALGEAEVRMVLRSSGARMLTVHSKRGGVAIRDRTYWATRDA